MRIPTALKPIVIKTLLFACTVLLTCAATSLAQNPNYDRCEVGVTNVGTLRSRSLGSFDTVVGEEERTTKAFRLPGTKLFVVAAFSTPMNLWDRQKFRIQCPWSTRYRIVDVATSSEA
jgi:hypothetical protein